MKKRVVITGMGAITPIGNTVDDFWASLKEGKVGIGPITYFDTTDYKTKLAAQVKDFNAKEYMDPKAARRMEAFSQFAVAAAKEALMDSKLDMEKRRPVQSGRIHRLRRGKPPAHGERGTQTCDKGAFQNHPSDGSSAYL